MDDGRLTLPDGVPARSRSSGRGNREHGDYATNVALPRRRRPANPAGAGHADRQGAAGDRGHRGRRGGGPGFINRRRPRSAGPGRRGHRGGRRRPTAPVDDSRAQRQPRVRLGQPDRPAAPRRYPVGRGRGRAGPDLHGAGPRSPASTTSTTPAPRSTGSRGRCSRAARGRADAGGRLRRRLHRRDRRAGDRRSEPDALELPDERGEESPPRRRRMMFDEIKRDLHDFGTDFDVYFHENDLHDLGRGRAAVARLTEMGNTYEKDGALVAAHRASSATTRTASSSRRTASRRTSPATSPTTSTSGARVRPLLYHARRRPPRLRRPDDGDARRVRRRRPGHLEVLIGQMVNLLRDGQPVRMSKRAGTVVTLDDLVDAVGVDAARYSADRSSVDSTLDIDLDLWTRAPTTTRSSTCSTRTPGSSILRNAADLGLEPDDFDLLLDPPREGDLMRTLGGVPARVARPPSCASRTGWRGTSRNRGGATTGSTTPAAGPAHGRRGGHRPAPRGWRWRRPPGSCSPTASACSASPPPSGCNDSGTTHEAAARARCRRPPRRAVVAARPDDVNALHPLLWSGTARPDDGARAPRRRRRPRPRWRSTARRCACRRGGLPPRAARSATPSRTRRVLRRQGVPLHRGRPLGRRGGAEPRRLQRRGAGRRPAAGLSPGRIGFHGNNKTSTELAARSRRASAGSSSTRSTRSPGSTRWRGEPTGGAGDDPGDRRRRGAHPRVHRHRARGPEVRLLDRRRRRRGRGRRGWCSSRRRPEAGRAALAHRQPDLRHRRLRGRRPPRPRPCRPASASSSASTLPEMDLGGGFGIAYTTQDDPSTPPRLATEMPKIVEHECRRSAWPPRGSRSSRAAPSSGRGRHRLHRGHGQGRRLDGGAVRTYVSVDGGMSDNIRTGAVRRRLLVHRRLPAPVGGRAGARPRGRQALRGRRHRGEHEFLPADVSPGDLIAVPGTGAYCRSMATNYNHALRPPVVAVRDGQATVLLRRETEDDQSCNQDGGMGPAGEHIRVALLGCGTVGSQVVRCCASRPTTSGRASARRRAGRRRRSPHRRAARGARRRCSPRTPRAGGHPRRRGRRRRGDRRHRAGPDADPARRSSTASRSSPPTRRCSPRTGRRWPRRPTRPAPTSTTRPRSPARSRCCGRCASPRRRPDHPGARHRQRHHQLHPLRDGRAPAPSYGGAREAHRGWATPRPTRPPTSRASTPPPRPRSSPRWPSTPGSPPPTCTARASAR